MKRILGELVEIIRSRAVPKCSDFRVLRFLFIEIAVREFHFLLKLILVPDLVGLEVEDFLWL